MKAKSGRGLLVIRRVTALYGLRPGLAVTLALMRRVAWTAAGTTGLSMVSQGLADHVLCSMPVLKHVAGRCQVPAPSRYGSTGSPASLQKRALL